MKVKIFNAHSLTELEKKLMIFLKILQVLKA
jgi:hypothetical protein